MRLDSFRASSRGTRAAAAAVLPVTLSLALAPPAPVDPVSTSSPVTELAGNAAVLIGGTGVPVLPDELVRAIQREYLEPVLGWERGYQTINLETPQGITADTYQRGMEILREELLRLSADEQVDHIEVMGTSQGAGILGMLVTDGQFLDWADPDQFHFTALAPPSVPGHGLFEAMGLQDLFEGMSQPFPVDSAFHVDVYCGMYDPICMFPDDQTNMLALMNAMAALSTVHGGYVNITTEDLESAVPWLIDGAGGNVDYWIIPTEVLPLLSGSSWLLGPELTASLDDYLRPLIDAAYDFDVPVAEAAEAAVQPDLWADLWEGVMALFGAA